MIHFLADGIVMAVDNVPLASGFVFVFTFAQVF